MALLGELLFYVATQDEPTEHQRPWTMPGWAVPVLARSLGAGDSVEAHYGAKTLENILAQSRFQSARFATQVCSCSVSTPMHRLRALQRRCR